MQKQAHLSLDKKKNNITWLTANNTLSTKITFLTYRWNYIDAIWNMVPEIRIHLKDGVGETREPTVTAHEEEMEGFVYLLNEKRWFGRILFSQI